jgi:hypothetical protein
MRRAGSAGAICGTGRSRPGHDASATLRLTALPTTGRGRGSSSAQDPRGRRCDR